VGTEVEATAMVEMVEAMEEAATVMAATAMVAAAMVADTMAMAAGTALRCRRWL